MMGGMAVIVMSLGTHKLFAVRCNPLVLTLPCRGNYREKCRTSNNSSPNILGVKIGVWHRRKCGNSQGDKEFSAECNS